MPDTIKVRMQVGTSEYSSTLKCIRRTISHEGFFALWKGITPAFVGAVSENATAFALNGQFNRILGPEDSRSKSVSRPFILGSAAGFVTAFVLCPSDIIKCRQQVLRASGKDIAAPRLISDLLATNGIRGFYIGIGAQIFRDVPFFAFFFGTYEVLCPLLTTHTSMGTTASCFVAGGISGQMAWVASLPFDAIKSVVQTNGVSDSTAIRSASAVANQHSSFRVALQMHATYGLSVFFRGLGVTLLRAFPSNAALFLGYEWSRKTLAW